MTCAPECATAAQGIALALLSLGTGLLLGSYMPPDARAVGALLSYVAAAALIAFVR